MTACTINGQQCTACCRTITLKYTREMLRRTQGSDAAFIRANWKPVSRRLAKKRNPHMFSYYGHQAKAFYRCARVTDAGCSVYDDRPSVCKDYPLYGRSYESVAQAVAARELQPEYHADCTEWPRIPVVQVAA
jgi:Fe-S-cluster containining protein